MSDKECVHYYLTIKVDGVDCRDCGEPMKVITKAEHKLMENVIEAVRDNKASGLSLDVIKALEALGKRGL